MFYIISIIKTTYLPRSKLATMHNTKLGYGTEITAVEPNDKSPYYAPKTQRPAYLKLKCGVITKKYEDYSDASITRQQQIMDVAKKFIEEELHEHSKNLNFTVVSLTGNRWVAVSIDTV